MCSFKAVVLCLLIPILLSDAFQNPASELKFPPHFKFGAATSAYQIEGGWNADGKGENIWDRFVQEHPDKIKGGATGDVAADSYHRWQDDIDAAADMGLHFYRFSINWARILPDGFSNKINKAGVEYYNKLIDGLLAKGIEPIVTLYHWELPVAIQNMGGWTNPHIVEWFGDYADIVFSFYADRVKTWLTVNEAISVCDFMYNSGTFAPGILEPIHAPYLCNKYILLAHARAYRIYHKKYSFGKGMISLANNILWVEPASPEYKELAELGRQHSAGRFCHPLMTKHGGWPKSIEHHMRKISLEAGYHRSRLPEFTHAEIEYMKGTADFLGLNYYTTNLIRTAKSGEKIGFWFMNGSPELNAVLERPPGSYFGSSPMLPVFAEGLRAQLKWLQNEYNLPILITENGFSSTGYELNDRERVKFLREHLEQIALSIVYDGVNVMGYTVWTLIDNFEWIDGYETKFGLYEIDFEHPRKLRTPRASAQFYGCVVQNRTLLGAEDCIHKGHNRRQKRMRKDNGGHKLGNGGFCLIIFLLKYLLS